MSNLVKAVEKNYAAKRDANDQYADI